ncbi:restriction endonuclease subunit S [Haemophilus parainfluenzae]|uniref:restriction endonuclease subunit S n=1 Tax=Haemophilus parainfluenzae TaxID=729 RepID=UPI000FFF53E5|nr:restriction endonuclease subunit S [Haemophilus parainfluenzae]KAB1991655.1 restriction endonuclease subunit S [Haemophilus parainfluenzae]QAT95280.1 restriction endonuclease subunit S [Haemophilus parainfluenzae]
MSNWQTVTLEDVAESINTGLDAIRRAPIVEHQTNLRCLRIQDISQDKPFNEWGFTETKKSDYEKYKLTSGDIIIARTGGSIGVNKLIRNDLESVFNNGLARIRVNKNFATPEFIYCVMQSINFKSHINAISSGTAAQPNMKVGDMAKFEFKLPPLNEQKKITETIFAFIDKIHLNTQINQTLEQIAQALFKSWFVDFDPVRAKVQALSDGLSLEQAELAAIQAISGKTPEELTALSQAQPDHYAELAETAKAFPCEMVEVDGVEVPKGWEMKALPEIIDFLEGPGIRNWQYTDEEDGIKFINIRCIQNGDLTLTTANKITKEEAFGKYKHFQLEEDDIVVSTSGTLGRFAFVRKEHLPLSLNTSVIRFRPIKNKSSLGFITGFVENQLQHELEIRASGSAQRNFGPTHLKQISLLVPDFKLLELHQKYASSLFEKRKQLLSEIDVLKDTRDLLLPKLLNGEI